MRPTTPTPYIFVHEFGHHFAGLADEYYTSDVAYQSAPARLEPWEPNVSADLTEPGTPLPTPWQKSELESYQKQAQAKRRQSRAAGRPESEMEELFRVELAVGTRLLSRGTYAARVGAFERALYCTNPTVISARRLTA